MEKQQQLHPLQQPLELQKLSDTCWVCKYASVNAMCKTYNSLQLTFDETIHSSDRAKALKIKSI